MNGQLVVRTAREADLDRLIEIHMSAFPDARGVEARRRNFQNHPLGGLDQLHVAERGGNPLAHAFLFALEVWYGGKRVKVGGIASVGVAPEVRGEAVARALLDELHSLAHARGDTITLLYPFRQGFYARDDYVPVTPSRLLALSPRAIPDDFSDPLLSPGTLRAATGKDREGIEHCYEEVASKQTGWIVRPPRLWEKKLLDERRRCFVLERSGVVAGYVAWTLHQEEPHAMTTLDVHELVAVDEGARRRLLGVIGAQRDQVTEVAIELDADDPIDRALLDVDRERWGTERLEHALGTLVGGPMVRILDVSRAFEERGYLADGSLDVAVDGAASLHVEVAGGRARVGAATGGPAVRLNRKALAAILYGGLSARAAARLGWLRPDDASTLSRADALFSIPPFFAADPF
jgi:predicted acetyltransferase